MTPAPAIEENTGLNAVQDHPEELDEQGNPDEPYGPRNRDLPEQLQKVLKATIQAFQLQETYLRRREIMRDRKNRFYDRGYQHMYWQSGAAGGGGFVLFTGGQSCQNGDGEWNQAPRFCDAYDIFSRYMSIEEAILTQNPPGIDFRPIDPSRAEDEEAAETAECYRHQFDRSNDTKNIQAQIVRMMGLSGRVVLWVRTEADAQKFGINPDTGEPKQMEICTVHGTLESRVPITAKTQKDMPYVFLMDDPDLLMAKNDYRDFADKIKENVSALGENSYERWARLGVLQGARNEGAMGSAFAHLTARLHAWLRPCCWMDPRCDEDFEEEPGVKVRDKLNEIFPSGCHAVFIGDQYVGSWDEGMDDAITIGHACEGDGQFRLATMDPISVVQDYLNDAMNTGRLIWDVGWPSTWISMEDQEYEAVRNQRADPFAIRQLKGPVGVPAKDRIIQERNPELPATFVNTIEYLQAGLPQFQLASPPSVFGAATPDNKTASGIAQLKGSALGQKGLPWIQIQRLMARMYYLAAICASKNPDHSKEIVVPSADGSNSSMKLEKLTKGHFGAYPDEDSSFPESIQAKRATMNGILEMALQNPAIAEQLLSAPENFKIFLSLNGFPELVIPEAEAAQRQAAEIEELLLQSPIPPDPAALKQAEIEHAAAAISQTPGTPAPPFDAHSLDQPSIPVNEYDFHQWHAAECQDWLNSEACRKQLAQGNQPGVDNVVLHWKAHVALIPPPPPPMAASPVTHPPAGPPKPQHPSVEAPAAGAESM